MITQKRLKELLHYEPETGIFTSKTKRYSQGFIGQEVGYVNDAGYLLCALETVTYRMHRLAWLYMYGHMDMEQLDHINHMKTDNRLVNLREVTNAGNRKNMPMQHNNTSGHTGVSRYYSDKSKYTAQIKVKGIKKHLGLFSTFGEAVKARKKAEVLYNFHGNHGNSKTRAIV